MKFQKFTLQQNYPNRFEMNKETVLVTGGAGFIGSHLVDYLVSQGFEVKVLDNLANGREENLKEAQHSGKLQFIKGDILSREDCRKAVEGVRYVFHLACLGVRHSIHSPYENHEVNAEGTLKVLEASRKEKIKHFFYISTSEIYGRTTAFPITEDAPTVPLTVYGASKLAGEHYANAFNECYGMPTTVLRIFNNYGPRAHYEGDAGEMIPRSIVRIMSDLPPVVFGDGSVTRDFFYVKDTARALGSLIGLSGIMGKTFNIGTGEEYTMRTISETLLELMGRQHLGISYMADRPADVPRLWVSPQKFVETTGFTPVFSFRDGLIETIKYYEELAKSVNMLTGIVLENWKKS